MNEYSPHARSERADTNDGEPDQFDASMRRARREAAERAEAVSGGRVGDRERLEHLLAALDPILRRIPPDADFLDVGVTQGFARDGAPGRPRLFIDMIGYVECIPGGGFRLAQSTRHGRVVIGEAPDLAGAMLLVADYVARRLVEREEALAGDRTVENAARSLVARERDQTRARDETPQRLRVETTAARARAALDADEERPAAARPAPARLHAIRERLARWRDRRGGPLERSFVFAIQFLGSALLTLIVALTAWWAWKTAGFVK